MTRKTGKPIIDEAPITYLGEYSHRINDAIEKSLKGLEEQGITLFEILNYIEDKLREKCISLEPSKKQELVELLDALGTATMAAELLDANAKLEFYENLPSKSELVLIAPDSVSS